MERVLIRNMKSDDIGQIIEIEKKCFSLPWSRESFEGELKNEHAYYECAEENKNIVGYMGMWKILDECHITNVAVLPEYRNRGIASMLIDKMIGVCKCSEIKNMTLEVRESNTTAINLYKKFGFFSVGKRPNYYQLPLEDAIIMWKNIY
ncbi:MAG: ribosomal protein S18-alanine N-acetyltransferase [Sedimentibacter sp.]|uniref:ribosomal protein S18-alanine N-acetyltransferase n=1 Tax=Sedimentibacter sp. TaxID=1960295 RepID=UPI002982691F|nr:ribosomal protein S18-alanine N-acetyltransferase [Sedimentibacter sp.]MDW5298783.1 ribosomal protein S18-alanine N-acetyltransferase [Sedimentibacter sp.]